ncbi:major histocompatibility complex class I-related gene protein-like isoform X3 [Eublepharis macularius]|uniref:Major histocompatibility complex class I-related gene protein-like isoform X3 n=1 Tax=Eublepharis macularius TaxID=481883 RepID=A0AA97J8A2_EUBMA|nr:major histocompatibility complex class I-related gene protein-like isoform X3 [Eublepharis macularius]
MGLLWRGLFFLGAVVVLLGGSSGSSSHFLHNLYMGVSEPSQGLPQFMAVGYVDGQLYLKYDPDTRRALPQVPWIEEIEMADPHYWEGQAQIARNTEPVFEVNLATVQSRYNQSHEGFHILQGIVSCELSQDGQPRGGRYQYAYDGKDFLAFDKETLTWTASVLQAEISKRKLEPVLATSQYLKSYLEEECIDWLRKHLTYGKKVLLRTEPPVVRMTRRRGPDGQETLICRALGFSPKEIYITWKKDGEAWQEDTSTRGVAPNSDGTYHTTLSVEIDPTERGRFRCHVDHSGLAEPLDLAWEGPALISNVGLVVGLLVGFLVVILLGVALGFYAKKRHPENCYVPTATNDPLPDNSFRGKCIEIKGLRPE